MTSEHWLKVKEVFSKTLELPLEARPTFLSKTCGDDKDLLDEVQSLLKAHEGAGDFLESIDTRLKASALDAAQTKGDSDSHTTHSRNRIGERIGAYRLVELIGTGGMGEVYKAIRDDDQYQAEVAIKLMRVDVGNELIAQRLKAERQILASLDHRNIARLFDGGTTEQGSPYLIMELVEGERLDRYCDRHMLSLHERLKLFCDVCAAVSYAHQHLVVHRDLKPGNILVTSNGTVKLLDFGIAKLLQASDDAADAEPTKTFMRALTPGYSSPEQILGRPITTASDVYSLGVVLYQLLTGRSPYRGELNSTQDAIREVCETEPLRPSELVSGSNTHLPRDLDAITLRALRKEPEKRYAGVDQFAEDIRRHLQGLPVIARGDQFSYQAGKYFRRHKLPIAAAALIVVALLGGMIASLHQARIAELERVRAERHFTSVRKLANTFMFQIHEAITDLPNSTDARRMLVTTGLEYLNTLANEAGDDHSLKRELAFAYLQVGDIQGRVNSNNIGEPRAAFDSYSQAIALIEPLVAAVPADTELRAKLATIYSHRSDLRTALGETQLAVDDLQQAITVLEALVAEHPTTDFQLDLAQTYTVSFNVLGRNNNEEQGLINTAKAIAILESAIADKPDDRELQFGLATVYANRAVAIFTSAASSASSDEALNLNEKAIALSERLVAATHGENARYLRHLFVVYSNQCDQLYGKGDYEGAASRCRAAQSVVEKLSMDTENAQILVDGAYLRWNLGKVLLALDDLPAATTTYQQNVRSLESMLKTSDATDLRLLLADSQQGLGQIEARLATRSIKDRDNQLKHWNAARQWFENSTVGFQNVVARAGLTALDDQDKASMNDAVSGLARANAALAGKSLN